MRANLGAMALFGGWVGFQFIATLYMQQLRGWSALETGLAIFPGGLLVALLAPRVAPLIARFGTSRLILAGLTSTVVAYALFLPIGLNSGYLAAMLPTFLLAGLGFALAFGPLNIAATNGVAAEEQGLAGGLVNTSFQFGGALTGGGDGGRQRQHGHRRLAAGAARRLPGRGLRVARRSRARCRGHGPARPGPFARAASRLTLTAPGRSGGPAQRVDAAQRLGEPPARALGDLLEPGVGLQLDRDRVGPRGGGLGLGAPGALLPVPPAAPTFGMRPSHFSATRMWASTQVSGLPMRSSEWWWMTLKSAVTTLRPASRTCRQKSKS